ncbi:MAG: arylsulfatase [Elusimicrobiaceae bacterium]|nr:arylsulfatase [Elusimicrobiaceae bacterium]MBT4439683.1 arylsulfatase [Elusimicrobiaceae bacterium]MBT5988023.1 arylsulfatase [Elusimicrobiaceae bacterium]MBT6715787.1 arylsulfatase [Elusimicrobiaceae bacterium]
MKEAIATVKSMQFWLYTLLIGFAGMILACDSDSKNKEFKGKIAKTYDKSEADWPKTMVAPKGSPNVLVWLLDDTGFAQICAFGGLIDTPNLDRVASNGLRYNNFHTTALSSPSRASILTGRNHHNVSMGSHAISAMGFPGYNASIPKTAAGIPKILQQKGYTTFALGKWDHTPMGDISIAGPFDRWPSGEGFDHFYGFMAADAHHYAPVLWTDHTPIDPSKGKPNYHLTTDLADKAVEFITGTKSARPDRPFFMFWATGAMHAPHHATKYWIDKYKGKFDMGWDEARKQILARQKKFGIVPQDTELSPRIPEIPAWDSLTAEQKKMYARQMEVFAAQLEHTDYEFGKILNTLERIGELDNTLIIITSDNGASGEGGLEGTHNEFKMLNGIPKTEFTENIKRYDRWGDASTYPHYHAGWAMAGNTPFKYFKQTTHRGGQQDPLIISWPKEIKAKGEIRNQYHHIIDLTPTILEATNTPAPKMVDGIKQMPMDGIPMNYSFNNSGAKDKRTMQYYEMFGNRAIYKDGWKAVAIHANRMPWNANVVAPFEDDVWELYNVKEDFAENNNLAEKYPKKLKQLKKLWDEQAWKYGVYPMYDDMITRFRIAFSRYAPQQDTLIFYPPGAYRIYEAMSPPIKNKSHNITAEINVPKNGASGVIATAGGRMGGYSFYVKDNFLHYDYNYFNEKRYQLKSFMPLPTNRKVIVKFKFSKTGDLKGMAEIFIGEERVAHKLIEQTIPIVFSMEETFDVGMDTGTSASENYISPFKFKKGLEKVTIEIE